MNGYLTMDRFQVSSREMEVFIPPYVLLHRRRNTSASLISSFLLEGPRLPNLLPLPLPLPLPTYLPRIRSRLHLEPPDPGLRHAVLTVSSAPFVPFIHRHRRILRCNIHSRAFHSLLPSSKKLRQREPRSSFIDLS